MPEFKSYRSYHDFAFSVINQWRFAHPAKHTEFLETLIATVKDTDKEEILPANSILCRAQIGHNWRQDKIEEGVYEDFPSPLSFERMMPRKDRAYEGRANVKGIPCLYVATHEETALAEVRPWKGTLVSIAQLRTFRQLRLINFTTDDKQYHIYTGEPEPAERERAVWRDIDWAFAAPVSKTDDVASYAPTQMLAEIFRQQGFDGVGYRSALGPGHNIALFDLDSADVVSCYLVKVDGVKLKYSEL